MSEEGKAGAVEEGGAKVDGSGANGPGSEDPRAVGRAHDLEIRIDRTLCVGFGDCIAPAPEAFDLDEEGIAILLEPESVPRERLLEACRACPVDAITALDAEGRELAP